MRFPSVYHHHRLNQRFFASTLLSFGISLSAIGEVIEIFGSAAEDTAAGEILRTLESAPTPEDVVANSAEIVPGVKVDAAGGKIYFINSDDNEVKRANLDGSAVQTVGTASEPAGLGLDLTNSKVYWGDSIGAVIRRANLDGSSVETVLNQSAGDPVDIEVDAAGGKIYWMNFTSNSVFRSDLDGTNIEPLADQPSGLGVPGSIELDLTNSKLYWTDDQNGIRRADLDGSNEETLIPVFTDADFPMSLILDVPNDRMYWTDAFNHPIRSATLDGTDVRDVHRPELGASFLAFDATNQVMYFTDYIGSGTSLRRKALPQVEVIASGLLSSAGLVVSGDQLYYVDSDIISFANPGSIHRSNLDGTGDVTLVPALTFPYGIDIDETGGKVYWSDPADGLFRANLDGTGMENLLDVGIFPLSIALDVPNGKIYWSDGGATEDIRRANLDGSNPEQVIDCENPYGIAIHPGLGKVYWIQQISSPAGIFRANLDGSNPETIVDAVDLEIPRSLKLDTASGKMYWTDAGVLRRANVDGTNIETVHSAAFPAVEIALRIQGNEQVYVDFAHVGLESGTQANPFNSLAEALGAVLPGGTIMINGASADSITSETPTIDQSVTLEAFGGAVRIGVLGGGLAPNTRGFIAPRN